jgi:hypothetical protein
MLYTITLASHQLVIGMDHGRDLYQLRDAVLALDEGERENLRALLDREEQRQPLRTTDDEDALWLVLKKLAPIGARHFAR